MPPSQATLAPRQSLQPAPAGWRWSPRVLLGGPALGIAAVIVGALVLPVGPLGAAIAAALGGLAVAAGLYALAPRLLCWAAGARRAGPDEQAEVKNLIEGLGPTMGVAAPALFVVPDRAPGAMVIGTGRRHAALVVTAGLAERLSRIELEGVVAHELAHLKAGEQVAGTLAGAVLGPLGAVWPLWRRPLFRPVAQREARADLAGVQATRYPPGLRSALEALRQCPAPGPRGRRGFLVAHLWISWPPRDDRELETRIEILGEL
jgi:heat shock protein HtpX